MRAHTHTHTHTHQEPEDYPEQGDNPYWHVCEIQLVHEQMSLVRRQMGAHHIDFDPDLNHDSDLGPHPHLNPRRDLHLALTSALTR